MSEEKWSKEQIFQSDANEEYGVAYKFSKSKIPLGRKTKIFFPLMFIVLFAGICAMGSSVFSGIIKVNSQNNDVVKLEHTNYYAVSTGTFSSIELASEIAGKIKDLGGAGYVYNKNGEYNVLMYVYSSREDALSVSQKVNEQGFNTSLFTFDCNAKSYDLNLSSEDKQTLKNAITSFDDIYLKLYTISNNYDNKQSTISASRLEIVSIQKEFERMYSKFLTTFTNTNSELITKLIKKLDIVSSELDLLVDPLSLDSNFQSLIKHSCINIVVARYEL